MRAVLLPSGKPFSFISFCAILALASCRPESKTPPVQDELREIQLIDLNTLPDSLKPEITEHPIGIKPRSIQVQFTASESDKPILGRPFVVHYTEDDILPNREVAEMAKSAKGGLWLNNRGISYFDGNQVQHWPIVGLESLPSALHEDHNGVLWLSAGNYISQFDGKQFKVLSDSFPMRWYCNVSEDTEGHMWIGGSDGLLRYSDGKVDSLEVLKPLKGKNVISTAASASGGLWIHSFKGIHRFKGNALEQIAAFDGPVKALGSSMLEDKKGGLWFRSYRSIGRFSDGQWTWFKLSEKEDQGTIIDMTLGLNGECWVATDNGLFCIENGQIRHYTKKDGLKDMLIYTVEVDESGNVWLGGEGGLSRLSPNTMTRFSKSDGLGEDMVISVAKDKSGSIWLGGYAGLFNLNQGKLKSLTLEGGLPVNVVNVIEESKNSGIWFDQVQNGLSYLDSTSLTIYGAEYGLPVYSYTVISEAANNDVWIGTVQEGLYVLSEGKTAHYSSKQGLAGNYITSIQHDGKYTWVTFKEDGIACFDGRHWFNLNSEDGLPSTDIKDCFLDFAGNLWVCTDAGLGLMPRGKKEELYTQMKSGRVSVKGKLFHDFNDVKGIAGRSYFRITQMPDSSIWVNGLEYLLQLTRDGESWKLTQEISKKQGYPVYAFSSSPNALMPDANGVLWVATLSEDVGLVKLKTQELLRNTKAPQVQLTKVEPEARQVNWYLLDKKDGNKKDSALVAYQDYLNYHQLQDSGIRDSIRSHFKGVHFSSLGSMFQIPENLELAYQHNKLRFQFSATDFKVGGPMLYRYYLEGYSKEWSDPQTETDLLFENLREGKYTLKVQAKRGPEDWSEPLVYSFTVLAPWWRTWWAYMLYLALAVLAVYWIIRWRERRLREKNRQLEVKVAERTFELKKEKQKSDDLLLNILPSEIADELKAKGSAEAKLVDQVTVLFTDFKGFTQIAESLSPSELVEEINECFSAFDLIMQECGVEKIKTIGDAYMAAGGLPTPNKSHAEDVVKAALLIQQFMRDIKEKRTAEGKKYFEIRIGVHTGPVVAGIVGIKKYAYDIWGDTVNTASRLEQSGEAGMVNVSESTYALIKDKYTCVPRGKIEAKGKGMIEMYYVEG